jgi:quercetin dioxygenase-like cupin family protein
MLCYFTLKKNSEIPIHSHKEHQIGYVLSGKLKFLTDNGEFIVVKGDSYLFDSNEKHGAKILDDSEVIDIFSPARNDYK